MNEKLERILGVLLQSNLFKIHHKDNNAIIIPVKSRGFDRFEKEGYIGFIQVKLDDNQVVFDLIMGKGLVHIRSRELDIEPEDVPRYLLDFIFSRLAAYFKLYSR